MLVLEGLQVFKDPFSFNFFSINGCGIDLDYFDIEWFALEMNRGGKNTQKNCTKKELHDPDNHDGVITHLEPDILECEVQWALESITMNKASGGDEIPIELF